MEEASLSFSNVSKSFAGSGEVIQDLTLNIRQGEFVSILGPSGSGKTTILRLAAGLTAPDKGTVKSAIGSKRTGRGYVFQDSHLMPWKNVGDNIELPLKILGTPKNEREGAVARALDLVGMRDAALLMPHELSGGMKMRVSLARALVSNPSLLLLDEPFSALDEFTRYHLGEELRRIWLEKKFTVLFVTHSVSEATFISDRVCVFSAKPMKLIGDLNVNLGGVRENRLRIDPRFSEELRKVYEVFNRVKQNV
jgi:NitT/TauT family transport system ATP-binding protein